MKTVVLAERPTKQAGLTLSDQQIRTAALDAIAAANKAVGKAIFVGQFLLEKKAQMPHGAFMDWRHKLIPELTDATAQRWMNAAERCAKAALGESGLHLLDSGVIEVEGTRVPLSQVLTAPEAELSSAAREARQLMFDFMEGKTIKDCLAAVVVEGDEPHRITRAHNGQSKGGTRGENRKDWPKFIQENLKCINSHLGHWKTFTPAQIEQAETHFKRALAKWPAAFLEFLAKEAKEEAKRR